MILGVGTDLVEIDRMRKACEKEYFVSRTFTEAESRQAGGNWENPMYVFMVEL